MTVSEVLTYEAPWSWKSGIETSSVGVGRWNYQRLLELPTLSEFSCFQI